MFQVEFFFPGVETFDSDGCECSKFGSFEDFLGLFDDFNLRFIGSALDEELCDPQSDFFDNVVDDGFPSVFIDEIFDFFCQGIEIVSGDTGNGLNLVLEGGFGVGFGELKMNGEFVLELVLGEVGSDKDGELMRCVFLNNVEFVEVDVGKDFKLVLLKSKTLEFDFGCEAVEGLGHWMYGNGVYNKNANNFEYSIK